MIDFHCVLLLGLYNNVSYKITGKKMNYKTRQEYHGRRAKIYLLQCGDVFAVRMNLHKTPTTDVTHEYTNLDEATARQLYETARNHAMGMRPQFQEFTKCAYDKNNIKPCCAANCPQRFKGTDFWEIYRTVCTQKTK